MKKEEFLVALEDILQTDETILENKNLEEMDEWDSLSKMAVMAYFKKEFNVELALSNLKEVKTPIDLIKLLGDKIQ
ncbi:MAG: hypothetical protein E7017_07650 [Alphaproteobacteria bacterium]|nr:hypothetical protein [Alphaproteobacteria bacterium]